MQTQIKTGMQKSGASLALAATLLSGTASSMAHATSPFYVNDFSNRSSTAPATEKTYAIPYVTGYLSVDIATNAYVNPSQIQDGWVKGLNANNASAYRRDDGNPLACLCCAQTGKHIYVRHYTGTVMTDGTVRFSGDIRPPKQWSGSLRNLGMYLGYDRFASMLASDTQEFYKHITFCVGFGSTDGTDNTVGFYANNYDGIGGVANTVLGSASVDTDCWYRFVVTMNLAASTYAVAVYDMGASQPTLETPDPATPVETFASTTFNFCMNQSAETGGISTLGLSAFGVSGGGTGQTDIDLTARFDNLKVDHQPQGAPDFVRVYQNDFAMRAYTRTVPGTTEYAYDNDRLAPVSGTYEYPLNWKLVRDRVSAYNPLHISGLDGWIRRNSGQSDLYISEISGNQYVRAGYTSGDSQFVMGCQRIGNYLTNGMMQVSVDITPPPQWYWTVQHFSVFIGSDAFYYASVADDFTKYVARFGFSAGSSSKTNSFYFAQGDKNGGVTMEKHPAAINPGAWYRFIANLDIDNATYTVNVYEMGAIQSSPDTPLPAEPVYTFTGDMRYRVGDQPGQLPAISTIVIGSYGVNTGYSGTSSVGGIDNIRIMADLTGEGPVEIYRNDFKTRTYTDMTGATRQAPLTSGVDRFSGGQDDWVLRGNSDGMAAISTANGNNSLHLGSEKYSGAAQMFNVQPLGKAIKHNTLYARMDVRPPAFWVSGKNEVALYLGDDRFYQGNLKDTQRFTNYHAMCFGFGSTSASADTLGVYPNVSIFASDGDGQGLASNLFAAASITQGNWYRFETQIMPALKSYTLRVYHMGATQPALDTLTPAEPVAVFEGLRFKRDVQTPGTSSDELLESLTSFGISSSGIRGGQLYPPEERALVDNLLFTVISSGTLLKIN